MDIKVRDNTKEIISTIKRELSKGYGFTPLIGSGLSLASGIMMGREFAEYFAHTLYICIGREGNKWNIRRDGWPDRPNSEELDEAILWIRREYKALCHKYDVPVKEKDQDGDTITYLDPEQLEKINKGQSISRPICPKILNPDEETLERVDNELKQFYINTGQLAALHEFKKPAGQSSSSKEYILESGIKALYDWRASLIFFAKLDTSNAQYMLLGSHTNQFVIDSFSGTIIWGKLPNLAHKVLLQLVRPLRIRKIITTNFDTLIEASYQQSNYKLTTHSVSISGSLPDPSTVWSADSLIKIHGTFHETRADFTLDDPPSEADKEAFNQYLFPGNANVRKFLPSHLLIIGTSISDKRIVEMIKYAMDRNKDLKTIIIVNSPKTLEGVYSSFEKSYTERFECLITKKADLFLYELYQQLTLTLPPGGATYQFYQFVPPEYCGRDEPSDFQKNIKRRAMGLILKKGSHGLLLDGNRFTPYFAESLFNTLSDKGIYCSWYELEDYETASAMVSDILKNISLQLGIFQQENVVLDIGVTTDSIGGEPLTYDIDKFKKDVERLVSYLHISPHRWCIFVLGRSGAGGCSGWINNFWEPGEFEVLEKILQALIEIGFKIIYMPYTQTRHKTYEDAVKDINAKKRKLIAADGSPLTKGSKATELADREFSELQERQNRQYKKEDGLSWWYSYWLPKDLHITKDIENFISLKITANPLKEELNDWFPHVLEFIEGKKPSDLNFAALKLTHEQHSKIRFLYGASLFRQSRYFSAFMTDAVYVCPYRFSRPDSNDSKDQQADQPVNTLDQLLNSLSKIDNDFNRSKNCLEWINRLGAKRVFIKKPGGHTWKYGDRRMMIQSFIESLKNIRFKSDGAVLGHYGQQRAKMHFQIGEWFLKAFNSTSNELPLLEAVYHRMAAIKFARFAKPSALDLDSPRDLVNIADYRCHLVIASLMELCKSVRLAKNQLRYWIQGFDGSYFFSVNSILSVFGVTEEQFLALLNNSAEKSALKSRCDFIHKLIGLEIPQTADNNPRDIRRKITDLFKDSEWKLSVEAYSDYIVNLLAILLEEANDLRVELAREARIPLSHESKNVHYFDRVTQVKVSRFSESVYFNPVRSSLTLSEPRAVGPNSDDDNDWKRYVDNICSKIEKLVDPKTVEIKDIIDSYENKESYGNEDRQELIKNVSRLRLLYAKSLSTNPAHCLALIKTLATLSYAYVKRAKLLERLSTCAVKDEYKKYRTKATTCWVLVCVFCFVALDLMRYVSYRDLYEEIKLKVKILALYALAQGKLNRFYEAHKRLNEANSLTYYLPIKEQQSEQFILRLRRAEVHLDQAALYKATLLSLKDATNRQLSNEDMKHLYMLHVAKLDEAAVSLESAEELMAGGSHSALWWGKLTSLRMRGFGEYYQDKSIGDCTPLFFRRKIMFVPYILKCLQQGLQYSQFEPFRKLYFLELHKAALKNILLYFGMSSEFKSLLQKHLRNITPRSDQISLAADQGSTNTRGSENFRNQIFSILEIDSTYKICGKNLYVIGYLHNYFSTMIDAHARDLST